MEKVFVNRDIDAETNFYNGPYNTAISAANTWVIPLMQKFEIPVSVLEIKNILNVGVRDYFLDTIVRKKSNSTIWPSEWKKCQTDAENEFNSIISQIIENGQRVKAFEAAYKKGLADYEKEIASLQTKRGYARYEEEIRQINYKIEIKYNSVSRMESNYQSNRRELIEDEKRYFDNMIEEKPVLGMAIDFVKIEGGALVYDKEKVEKHFAVYAKTEKEVELLNNVKQLAILMNKVYGSSFPGTQVAFYQFFRFNDGKIIISPEIKNETLNKYIKNTQV